MGYLSPQIEAYAKKKKQEKNSLVKMEVSCGIFQDYGDMGTALENRAKH